MTEDDTSKSNLIMGKVVFSSSTTMSATAISRTNLAVQHIFAAAYTKLHDGLRWLMHSATSDSSSTPRLQRQRFFDNVCRLPAPTSQALSASDWRCFL